MKLEECTLIALIVLVGDAALKQFVEYCVVMLIISC